MSASHSWPSSGRLSSDWRSAHVIRPRLCALWTGSREATEGKGKLFCTMASCLSHLTRYFLGFPWTSSLSLLYLMHPTNKDPYRSPDRSTCKSMTLVFGRVPFCVSLYSSVKCWGRGLRGGFKEKIYLRSTSQRAWTCKELTINSDFLFRSLQWLLTLRIQLLITAFRLFSR